MGESRSNYVWLRELGLRLGEEYTFRYGKRHKSHLVIESMPEYLDIEDIGLTKFALAMPDEFSLIIQLSLTEIITTIKILLKLGQIEMFRSG